MEPHVATCTPNLRPAEFEDLTMEMRKANRKETQRRYYAAHRDDLNEQNKRRIAMYMLDPAKQYKISRARIISHLNAGTVKRPHKKTVEKYALMYDAGSGRYV